MVDSGIVSQLANSALFADLDEQTLQILSNHVRPLHLPAGATLLEQGDPGDSVFVVATGRLRAFVTEPSGTEVAVGEIGAGEVVGEMALLSSAPRSATIRAIRDSSLLELPHDHFMELVVDQPQTLIAVTRLLVDRLQRSIHRTELGSSIRVIAVIPVRGSETHATFALQLQTALEKSKRIVLIDRGILDGRLGADRSESDLIRFLHHLETDHDVVLLVGDVPGSEWTQRCRRQADLVLAVADGHTPPPQATEPASSDGATQPNTHLVLTHLGPALPRGTLEWLESVQPDRHHHVRLDDVGTVDRVARILNGESVAVVLSGGGARGFAHLGVLKALLEAGVPIDHVGGASFGATISGCFSLGMSWDETYEASLRATVNDGSLVDFTFPAVALSRGRKLTTGIQKAYGDANIEDAWLDYFCVSADLSAGRLRIHDRGSLWRAVRASVSIPGTFPPVLGDGENVLVDGGIMNNLPVDIMRKLHDPGHMIAVDLRAGTHIPSRDLDDTGAISGWKVAIRRLNPFAPRMEVPRMMDVLLRSTASASGEQQVEADVMLRPPVEQFGILEFKRHREIIEAGYTYAVKALQEG